MVKDSVLIDVVGDDVKAESQADFNNNFEAEETQKSFFKTKGAQLIKISLSDLQEIKIGECPVSFLSKVVAIGPDSCLLIGGSSDIKQSKVFPYVFEACSNPSSINRKANMGQARAAFGCYLNREFKQVYIVGGSIN